MSWKLMFIINDHKLNQIEIFVGGLSFFKKRVQDLKLGLTWATKFLCITKLPEDRPILSIYSEAYQCGPWMFLLDTSIYLTPFLNEL